MAYEIDSWMRAKGLKSKTKHWFIRTNQTIINYVIGSLIGSLITLIITHYGII